MNTCACGCKKKVKQSQRGRRRCFYPGHFKQTMAPAYLKRLAERRKVRKQILYCACGCGKNVMQDPNGTKFKRYLPGHYRTFGSPGRMKGLLSKAASDAEKRGYLPPKITAEGMVEMWVSQKELCAACGGPFQIINGQIHFDHDHKTGEPRGFIHAKCNQVEGMTRLMSDQEFRLWLLFYRPEVLH